MCLWDIKRVCPLKVAAAFTSHLAGCHFATCLGDICFMKDPAPCLNSAKPPGKALPATVEAAPRERQLPFIFQEPGVGLIPGRIPQPSAGCTRGGCLIPSIGQLIHIPGFVCLSLASWSATQVKALVLRVLCLTSVAFSPMQQRNNGPLLRFLFSGMLGGLCLIFVSGGFFVN